MVHLQASNIRGHERSNAAEDPVAAWPVLSLPLTDYMVTFALVLWLAYGPGLEGRPCSHTNQALGLLLQVDKFCHGAGSGFI